MEGYIFNTTNEEIETNDVPQLENNTESNSIDDFFK